MALHVCMLRSPVLYLHGRVSIWQDSSSQIISRVKWDSWNPWDPWTPDRLGFYYPVPHPWPFSRVWESQSPQQIGNLSIWYYKPLQTCALDGPEYFGLNFNINRWNLSYPVPSIPTFKSSYCCIGDKQWINYFPYLSCPKYNSLVSWYLLVKILCISTYRYFYNTFS